MACKRPGETFCSFQIYRKSIKLHIEQESSVLFSTESGPNYRTETLYVTLHFHCYGFQKSKHTGCQLQCKSTPISCLLSWWLAMSHAAERSSSSKGQEANLSLSPQHSFHFLSGSPYCNEVKTLNPGPCSQEPLMCLIYKDCVGTKASHLILYIQVTLLLWEEKNKSIGRTFKLKFFFKDLRLIKRGQCMKEDLFHMSYTYTIINELY